VRAATVHRPRVAPLSRDVAGLAAALASISAPMQRGPRLRSGTFRASPEIHDRAARPTLSGARALFPLRRRAGAVRVACSDSRGDTGMLKDSRTVRIEWGDCDPAGIVYFPRYFAIFDASTTALFEHALGMTKFQFVKHYGCVGYPMVDVRARFLVPTRYGDDVTVETTVSEIKRSSFSIEHRLFKASTLAAEGFETRVWVGRDRDDPDRITSTPIPGEIVERLSAG